MDKKKKLARRLVNAAGEILFVMIGILLALQVDNWNEDWKDQVKVKHHLQEILLELKFDLKAIRNMIKEQEISYKANKYVQDFLNRNITKVDSEKLKYALFRGRLLTIFNNSKGAFSSLINDGYMEMIQDNTLKRTLINFHNDSHWYKIYINGPMLQTFKDYQAYVHSVTTPEMIQNYVLNISLTKEFSAVIKKSYKDPESFPVDVHKVKSDPKFSDVVDRMVTNRIIQNMIYHEWENEIEELIIMIESTLRDMDQNLSVF